MARTTSTDHPRACGANAASQRVTASRVGSSPRVRGKRPPVPSPAVRCRIIPARAGQTRGNRRSAASTPDHPRACGANSGLARIVLAVAGSSPRVRGKRTAVAIARKTPRIIPARAGQTRLHQHQKKQSTDHPRACGANMSRCLTGLLHTGSSPRVRGKLDDDGSIPFGERIIPARAGQT